MKSCFIFLSFLFLIFPVLAQQSPNYKVSSFYQASGYLTERFLPFAVYRQNGSPVELVVSVAVEKPCYSMIDPHRSHIFHIYCAEAAEPKFKVVMLDQNQQFSLELPEITVKKIALISSTPKPVDPNPSDPFGKGRKLFINNCARCHPGQYPLPSSVTTNSMKAAFNSYSSMSQFRNFFNATELNDLSKYINEGL